MKSKRNPFPPPGKPSSSRIITRWVLRTVLGSLILAVMLFSIAGDWHWLMGWVYIPGLLAVGVISGLVVDPGLLAERSNRRHANQAGWDKVLFPVYGTLTGFLAPIFAAIDHRYGWSPDLPIWLLIIAVLVYFGSWGVNIWAMVANRYFAEVARIQTDRGQQVMTGGPYQWVRHPGYLTGFFLSAAMPLVLQSLWGLLVSIPAAFLLVLRTHFEDRMLMEELEGYRDYARAVPYRLLPGIW